MPLQRKEEPLIRHLYNLQLTTCISPQSYRAGARSSIYKSWQPNKGSCWVGTVLEIYACTYGIFTEQLMGSGASAQHAQLSLTDPKVCRSYMAGTCPHDLFTNTKQDLGPCPKIHSEPLKTEYEGKDASEKAKLGFEFDYSRDMQKYIDECNRRIDAAQRRLEKTPDEIRQTNELVRCSPHAAGDTDERGSPTAKTDIRAHTVHQYWPPRSRHPGRILQYLPRCDRAPQNTGCESCQGRERARIKVSERHQWPIRSSETASLRCVRRISQPT